MKERQQGGIMYKPNGEEPMTKQEEQRRKEDVAGSKAARTGEYTVETLRSAFYAALYRSSMSRQENVAASYENVR
jgi:hypothetical protein